MSYINLKSSKRLPRIMRMTWLVFSSLPVVVLIYNTHPLAYYNQPKALAIYLSRASHLQDFCDENGYVPAGNARNYTLKGSISAQGKCQIRLTDKTIFRDFSMRKQTRIP
jgi:hypothetical protein